MSESSGDQIATAKHQPNSITSDSHRVTNVKKPYQLQQATASSQQPTPTPTPKIEIDLKRNKRLHSIGAPVR